jgi:hypothetical protein
MQIEDPTVLDTKEFSDLFKKIITRLIPAPKDLFTLDEYITLCTHNLAVSIHDFFDKKK